MKPEKSSSPDHRKDPCCPKCGGKSGYEYELTETHKMFGDWGHQATAGGGSGYYVGVSLAKCVDCGGKFQLKILERKGLA